MFLQWSLKNFSYCWQKHHEYIMSPECAIDMEGIDTKWKLCIYPRGDRDENFLSVYLHRKQDVGGPDTIDLAYKLEICSQGNIVYQKDACGHKFEKK
ncbi:hypothetical protein CEXT_230821 [Caerostris extrusa]|uniref:MATH domain-containing protein n=1 Tax=Caerostris extrusa TaxID=172846 RepID=A0AAV4RL64_CAEEX|nr:hypothetical protein CEXT_230821 [Caerostris extrusa]